MIERKDLREGNLVTLAHESNIPIVTINELREGWATFKETKFFTSRTYDLIMPINLNPDWLFKLGFMYDKPRIQGADMWQGLGYWSKGDLLFRGNFSRTKPIELKLSGYFNSSYQFVHDIQNITYYLTNEELTLKTTNTI